MDKLKRKIIKYFVLCVFSASVTETLLDSLFMDCMFPYLDREFPFLAQSKPFMLLTGIMILLITFAVYFVYAFIFYMLTSKAINAESKRQVSERNMQYSSICHDLKTPMTSVQGFAAALREDRIKPEEQKEIFNIIYNKSCYMNELVERMFTYSKLNTDNYKLSLQKVDLGSLVRNLVAINYDEFEAKDIDLQVKIPEEAINCSLDEKEMKRSINNLIINSYKHNQNGAKVMIQVYRQDKYVYVVVADNGKAISKEQERNIFEPFVCGDTARSSGNGNGLGLTISKIIIEKHGGILYINNDIGGYTKGFVVKMPLKR